MKLPAPLHYRTRAITSSVARAVTRFVTRPVTGFVTRPVIVAVGALALCVVAFGGFPQSAGGFLPDEAAKILRYLSDDARGGRASFTEGNREAAQFIAAEFGRAGLVPTDSAATILRPFTVRRVAPGTLSVVLNGAGVPDTECFISTAAAEGSWTLSDSFKARTMGPEFDREFLRKGSGVVLIPRVHASMFQRYRRSASRPRITEGTPEPGAVVAILADSVPVRSVSATYRGTVDTPELANVVGVIPGNRKDEVVLFSAHYDHLGIRPPVNGDSIANGADDDASGCTALILLARHFASSGRPERTLVFAALAAEEIGGYGSRHLVREMNPDKVVAMINIEMIGTDSKFGPRTYWITGYDTTTFGKIVSDALNGSEFKAFPDPYPKERLFWRSDNASFARAGVPAHSLSTSQIDVDSVYHTVDDEFDRIDPAHVAEIARGISIGVRGIVAGTATPTRIPRD